MMVMTTTTTRLLPALVLPPITGGGRYRVMSSSSSWMKRHVSDPYVRSAQEQGWRSRASFKLLHIQEKERVIQRGQRVIDLGASPGGWSQVAVQLVGAKGKVVSIDLNDMKALPGCDFLLGDFTDPAKQQEVIEKLGGARADVILSDMAPSFCGDQTTDHLRTLDLCYQVLEFAEVALRHPKGVVCCKFLRGRDDRLLVQRAKENFLEVKVIKPKSSRQESSESYLLARKPKPKSNNKQPPPLPQPLPEAPAS